MTWSAVWAQIAPMIVTLVGLLLTWALTEAIRWLRERTKDTLLGRAVDAVETLVDTVVKELQQTVVEDLKAAAADGKLTPDEIRMVKDKAVGYVMSKIPQALRTILEAYLGPLEEYVSARIEARIYELKHFEVVAPKS